MRPPQQVISALSSRISAVWKGYVALTGVQEENARLRKEISELKGEMEILQATARENQRLRRLLQLKTRNEFPSLVAQVIGEDASGWYRTFFINRGAEDGVFEQMPAAVGEGVVGRVKTTSSKMSKILLITDPDLAVDCRVARTRDRGVLSGYLDSGCVLRYIDLKSSIRVGDNVVTSGLDGVFPKGLPLGKVKGVRKGSQGLFLEAAVTPAVDFSMVEEVLLITDFTGGFDIRPGLEFEGER
jgi:rod shape-determining protein MreC